MSGQEEDPAPQSKDRIAAQAHRQRQRARRDLVIMLAVVASLLAIAAFFSLIDMWHDWLHHEGHWHGDEIMFALAIASLGLAWLSYRRWQDMKAARAETANLAYSLEQEAAARRRVEEDLRSQIVRFNAASQSAKLGYYIWDVVNDRCLYCSEEYARLYGYTVDEYLALSGGAWELQHVHPDDLARYQQASRETIEARSVMSMEYRIVTAKGEVRNVRLLEHKGEVEDGQLVRSEGTLQDITDLKRAQTQLVQALNASSTIFGFFDAEDRLIAMNDGYKKLLSLESLPLHKGITYSDVLRHGVRTVLPGLSAEQKAAWVALRLDRRKRPAHNLDVQIQSGDWVQLNDLVLEDGSVLTTGEIITERKVIEERLRRSQRLEAVGQLTNGIAQDFNNLLSVIQGNAELLELEQLDQPSRPVSAILEASQRGSDLVQRLLAFSRQQALKLEPIHLSPLLQNAEGEIQDILGPDISLSIACGGDLWQVRSDRTQLRAALRGLAENAAKAMPEGGSLTITARNQEHGEAAAQALRDSDYVSLTLADTGCGMPPEILSRAVEPFFTTDTSRQSSGLGLSTILGFMQQTGGRLLLDSQEEKGTSVTLLLPRALDETDLLGPMTPETAGKGEIVLVVDDDNLLRASTAALLELIGYRPLEALNAQEALTLLQAGPVDLILADRDLVTAAEGIDFAAAARGHRPGVKLLFMVSQKQAQPADDAVLTKPFWRSDLVTKVKAALSAPETG
ncbi:MAG: ATP-binding protein [Pseudomonadota bacterium]